MTSTKHTKKLLTYTGVLFGLALAGACATADPGEEPGGVAVLGGGDGDTAGDGDGGTGSGGGSVFGSGGETSMGGAGAGTGMHGYRRLGSDVDLRGSPDGLRR